MRLDDMTRVLFGELRFSAIPVTASNAWSVDAEPAPHSLAWREAASGTLTMLTAEQYTAHSTIRGSARIQVQSFGPANPIGYRLLIFHGTEILQAVHYDSEANEQRPLAVLVYLPDAGGDRVITWRLDFRGVSARQRISAVHELRGACRVRRGECRGAGGGARRDLRAGRAGGTARGG